MKIAIGCDPNAQEAKEEIIKYIEAKGYGEVTDFGSDDPIYANVAIKVGEAVASKEYDRGILICGTGIGVSIAANKVKGAYAALVSDVYSAQRARLSNDANIENSVKNADLVIGAVLIPGKAAPKIMKEAYLKEMRPGSVIVDVAVDQGGCCETTKVTYNDDPIYEVDGVVHYCVGNMPGAVPRTSTIALTNATLPYGLLLASHGLEEACRTNPVLISGVNTYDGKLTCKNVADSFGMEYTDLKSLL